MYSINCKNISISNFG